MYEQKRQKTILFNYFLYVICFVFVCFIGISNVLAYSYTVIGDQANITVVLVSPEYSSQPFNVPINSSYNFNSVLQIDYIISNYNFDANKHYQLESHLTQQTLTNANSYSVTGYNGEQCLNDYSASIFSGAYPRWDFQCPHATNTITLSIKNNANQYLWSNNGIYTWTSALLSYSTEPIPSSSTDTDTIINNNNQNTQNIINNNNQNTQDIINSNKVCNIYDKNSIKTDNKYIFNSNGDVANLSGYGITDYISINKNSELVALSENSSSTAYFCFYNTNKDVISCSTLNNLTTNKYNIPTLASYLRVSINKTYNLPTFQLCDNGNQVLNDSINNLDDTLNDDSVDTSDATSFFSDFTDNTHGLSGVISAPLVAINKMLDGQCSPLSATWRGQTVSIDCGYTFWGRLTGFKDFLNIALDGLLCYRILVKLFKLIEKIKNPNDDRVEVMDL